ncbi:MAG: hypothetical protein WAM14_08630 [Candidatus Nitrosopolaris sp.]
MKTFWDASLELGFDDYIISTSTNASIIACLKKLGPGLSPLVPLQVQAVQVGGPGQRCMDGAPGGGNCVQRDRC